MKVIERLAQREPIWHELDSLLFRLEARAGRRPRAADVLQLGALYRAACADLMRAEAYDLPSETVAYLQNLVARGHNALYRPRRFQPQGWARAIFVEAPARLRRDPALKLSALVFFGGFLLFALAAAARPEFAADILGSEALEQVDQMYADTDAMAEARNDAVMAGYYVVHNAGIGLKCYAWGLLLGLGTLYKLLENALSLGLIFGYMATSPHATNFFTFVTAHSSFELTAIVFAGAAGLRLGWGLIETKGQTRIASLRREAIRGLPSVGASVVLFVLAASIEGFVSASPLPYWVKATVALVSAALLIAYLFLGGRGASEHG